MPSQQILEKIRKCMALSKSSNEHEAAAALRQAYKLMAQHGITEGDVLAAEACEARAKSSAASKPSTWEAGLSAGLGRIFGCRVIFRADQIFVQGGWFFVGGGANPEVAKYCFEVLLRQLKRGRADYIKEKLKRCRTATKTRRADLYCESWVLAALGKAEELVPGEREQQAVDAFMARYHPTTSQLKTTSRNGDKRTLNEAESRDWIAGRRGGAETSLNHGVGSSPTLALE